MRIDIITIFPEMFREVFGSSIIKRGQEKGIVNIFIHQLREYTVDKHRTVDDKPYGGGPGMVMMPEPILKAMDDLQKKYGKGEVCILTPQGEKLNQDMAKELSGIKHIYIICGHYEGIDERVSKCLNAREISIGDYILSGGELPAMVLVDAVVRLVPGVLGDSCSVIEESFSDDLLEYPHYTRPREVKGHKVPEVLLSGNHNAIRQYRNKERIDRTIKRRPEFYKCRERNTKE